MRRFFQGVVLTVLICMTWGAYAVPQKELWMRWTRHNPDVETTIDYAGWRDFLAHYVVVGEDGVNRVNYKAVTKEDKEKLKAAIAAMEALPIRNYRRDRQVAFWINLYNAAVVNLILDHYPVESIRRISLSSDWFKWFARGPWDDKLVTVEGVPLSLNEIQHRILRPIWSDPRIHYALSCGAYSCPNLQPLPYMGPTIEQMLDKAAHDYVNNPRGVSVEGKNLTVSSLYLWYAEDFGKDQQAIIDHIKQYAEPELKKKLDDIHKIYDHEFDWSLNDVKN